MEIFKDVGDYIKTRLTNPFLGTLILVLFFHNFEFFFALFNFHEKVTLTQKVTYIREYYSQNFTVYKLFVSAFYAVLILTFTFLFLLLTRTITNAYTLIVNVVNKATAKGSVVSIDVYERERQISRDLKNERDSLRDEVNIIEEKKRASDLNSQEIYKERLKAEDKVKELTNSINALQKEFDQRISNMATKAYSIRTLRLSEQFNHIIKYNGKEIVVGSVIENLHNEDLINGFLRIVDAIRRNPDKTQKYLKNEVDKFIDLDLIKNPPSRFHNDSLTSAILQLTPVGEKVYEVIMNN